MSAKIIVSDGGYVGAQTHAANVKSALLISSDLLDSDVEIRLDSLLNNFNYAVSVGAIGIIDSSNRISLLDTKKTALQFYKSNLLQLFQPSGANVSEKVFESNGGIDLPSIIIAGAGDAANETGYDIEFFSPDPITGEPDLSSNSNGYIAGQIYKIKVGRNCSWWEARYCARMTGSEGGIWDTINGYGLIDVDAAIAYAGAVPDDPFITLGAVGILTQANFGNNVGFIAAAVANALGYVFEYNSNNAGWIAEPEQASRAYTYVLEAGETVKVRYKAVQNEFETAYSNEIELSFLQNSKILAVHSATWFF